MKSLYGAQTNYVTEPCRTITGSDMPTTVHEPPTVGGLLATLAAGPMPNPLEVGMSMEFSVV